MKNVIVKISGGLGNQMFQYAFAKAYTIKNKKILIIDDLSGFGTYDEYNRDFALDQFNIKDTLLSEELFKFFIKYRLFWRVLKKLGLVLKEKDITSYDSLIFNNRLSFIDGYWQSPMYFDMYRKEIKNDFSIQRLENKEISISKKQINNIKDSVAIGLRFFQEVKKDGLHQVVKQDYYIKAIKYVKNKVDNPHFFIFTNDIQRAKNLLSFEADITIINPIKDNRGAIYDLHLMQQCKHFIISNSTFHWWGAYLGENQNSIVIAPKNGYYNKNMMKENWITL